MTGLCSSSASSSDHFIGLFFYSDTKVLLGINDGSYNTSFYSFTQGRVFDGIHFLNHQSAGNIPRSSVGKMLVGQVVMVSCVVDSVNRFTPVFIESS